MLRGITLKNIFRVIHRNVRLVRGRSPFLLIHNESKRRMSATLVNFIYTITMRVETPIRFLREIELRITADMFDSIRNDVLLNG